MKTFGVVEAERLADTFPPRSQITKRQSCHLPVTADGAPIMGKIPQYEGAYVGESRSCAFMHV
jgi:glycine/D-amino acid oxidase-like deaminating enzyme